MNEIKVGVTKTYTVPEDADLLTITHEWGDVVLEEAVVDSYDFKPDSIGVHKFVWSNNTAIVSTVFYLAYVPLVTWAEFSLENEELDDFDEDFAKLERVIRYQIQNYTGQVFGPLVNKTLEVQGDGGDSLYLPVPIVALTSINTSFGDDITELVEVSPNDTSFLQKKSRFRGSYYFEVKRDMFYEKKNLFNEDHIFEIDGTFGWEYVPAEVTEASKVLVADFMGNDDIAEMRSKGVFETQLGDFRLRLNADQWGTTGNTRADNLLAKFVNVGLGLV